MRNFLFQLIFLILGLIAERKSHSNENIKKKFIFAGGCEWVEKKTWNTEESLLCNNLNSEFNEIIDK